MAVTKVALALVCILAPQAVLAAVIANYPTGAIVPDVSPTIL